MFALDYAFCVRSGQLTGIEEREFRQPYFLGRVRSRRFSILSQRRERAELRSYLFRRDPKHIQVPAVAAPFVTWGFNGRAAEPRGLKTAARHSWYVLRIHVRSAVCCVPVGRSLKTLPSLIAIFSINLNATYSGEFSPT
jgi:hypothetical protein